MSREEKPQARLWCVLEESGVRGLVTFCAFGSNMASSLSVLIFSRLIYFIKQYYKLRTDKTYFRIAIGEKYDTPELHYYTD
jgi:hypothetical protein